MRDRIPYSMFCFNVERQIKAILLKDERLLRTAVSASPKCPINSEEVIRIPKDFRRLRALVISQWFFEENLHWKFYLRLWELRKFPNLNEKQKMEISVLLESKEICLRYLWVSERYSGREIFGNLLGNDLRDSIKILRTKEKEPRPKKKIRHRGYRDKGSLRPIHRWLENSDWSLTKIQQQKERHSDLQTKWTKHLKDSLRITFEKLESQFEESRSPKKRE